MKLLFGPLEPDKPEHLQRGLQTADNVYPSPDGYRPVKAFDAMTPALAATFQGGASFVASDSTVQMLAGTASNLYRFDSTLAWSSMIGGLSAGRWYFTQFNNNAIATHGGAPVDVNILAGTAAALAGSPPNADFCATVRDFVVLAKGSTITWSGFQDRAQWTAGTSQSGSQTMLAGGIVTGLAGGEYGLIFQRSRISRMSYAGPPTIWQFDEISANIGAIAAGSIARAGRITFFLSDRGFMKTDGNDVAPIGNERVDRTFLTLYTQDDIDEFMYSAVDPANHTVIWAMPGKLWIYNWLLDLWSTSTWNVKAAFTGFTAGLTLEQVAVLYPNLDTMTPSLDDPEFRGGLPLFLCVNASNQVGTLTGANLQATFEMPNLELFEGRETRLRQIRPISDAVTDVAVSLRTKSRLGETGTYGLFDTTQGSGDIDCRASGRYIKPTMTIAAGTTWTYAQGIEVNAAAGGGRR